MLILFPFASSLHAHRCCVFRKHGEIAQEQSFSSLQSNRGERSNIPSGALRTTPLLRMLHTFRAAVRKWGSFFFSEAERCPCFTERMRLTFCLCHMVYKTTRKEYGILYLCLYLYCRIGILLYCCISVFSYYSLYLLFAIRIYISIFLFPFLMFNLNFLA